VPFVEHIQVHYSHVLDPTWAAPIINPRLTVKDHAGAVVREFGAGTQVQVSLVELSAWAGVDLDSVKAVANADGTLCTTGAFRCPSHRMAGLRVLLDAEYTNMDPQEPFGITPRATVTVRATNSDWNTDHSLEYYNSNMSEFSVMQNSRVSVELSTRGSMGQFRPILVATSVVYVIVLLKLAGVMVDTFARIFIKSWSPVHRGHTDHEEPQHEEMAENKSPGGTVQVALGVDSGDLLEQVGLLKDAFLYGARSNAQRDHEMHDLNRKLVELRRQIETLAPDKENSSADRGSTGGATAAPAPAPVAAAEAGNAEGT